MKSEASKYLLTTEAARLLGVSENTVRLWANAGRLGAERTATGVRLFRRSEVEDLSAERSEQPADDAAWRDATARR